MNTETTTETLDPKILALAKHLDCDPSDITETTYGEFEAEGGDYRVLTEEEANDATKEYIEQSIWAFNADFILSECGLPWDGKESLQKMQSDSCEGANDFLLALVEKCCGLDSFVESAISADGRGHFLSGYDGEEVEETINGETYYIYRTN